MANFNNFFYKAVRLIGNYVSLSNDVAFREDPSEYKNRFNFDTVKKLETVDGCNEVIDDIKKEMEYYSSKNGEKDKERVELAKELIRTILLIHGNNAKVNESMENPKYKAYAYFGSNFSGLDSDLESDDWMEIEDFCHDMLMQGNYCEIQNNESGKSVRITPDEYIDTFDGEFLYKASDLEESIKEDANGKEIKRYSDVYGDEVKQRGWWYFTTHGVQPGSIPKDLNVLEVRDGKNNKGTMGTFVRLDGILNTSELKEFDMKEMSPIDEAIGDFAYERQLLGRLKADCDYVLDTCVGENGMSLESSQKHLWAGSTGNQIAKMRELHQLSADMDSIVTDADIDEYERRFKDAWSKEDVSESLKEADLNERNLTRAERYNRNANKIFSYKRATDNAMKKYLIDNGVSEDEAEKLFQDDKLDVKLRELGLHDDFFDMWNSKKYDYDKSGEFYLMPEDVRKEWKPNLNFKHIKDVLETAIARGKYMNNERDEVMAALDLCDKKQKYTPEQRKYIRDSHQEMWRKNRKTESISRKRKRVKESLDSVWADYESIEKFLRRNNFDNYELVDYSDFPMQTSRIAIAISGDWKHDHGYFKYLINKWAKENNRNIFKIDEDDEPSDDDWYRATYYIYITKDKESYDRLNSMRGLFAEGKKRKINESHMSMDDVVDNTVSKLNKNSSLDEIKMVLADESDKYTDSNPDYPMSIGDFNELLGEVLSILKNSSRAGSLKEAKQWSTKYPQYEYEFDDGIKITAADETEAREKYNDIIENRYTGVRSKDDIDNLAQQLYDSGDAWAFNYFSDEELAILWALCSLDEFGRAYDDEVYEAIYTQSEPQKIFKKAQKYYNKYNVQSEVTLHEDKEDDDFETLKATVKNMTNDFKDAEGDLSDFYMTWNFGYNNDGFVTGGIDIRMNDRNDLDKAEEAKKKVEAIFAKNGFELDKTFPKNPGKTLFGGIHYQIISKDKILSESLKEGAEGRKEPGFEFVILDMTDEKNPTVVAKRTTKVESEWAALKMSGRAYGHKGMKKFDGKELEVQKAPIGEYKIGDTIDLDDYPYYNESLKEGYGEYITLELADKTNRKIIKDLYDRNELSIVQRGDCWYTEDCPARYFKIVKEEMKKYFPKLSYLYDAQPYKSQLEKSIMRKLSNESLKESASDGDFLVKYEAVIYDDNLENFNVLEVIGERTVTKEQVIKKFPFTQKGFDWMTKEDWEEWGSDEHYDESLSSYIFRASGLNNDPLCKKRFREIVEENPEEDNLFARYEVETLNPDVFKSRVKKMSTFLGKKLLSGNESLKESTKSSVIDFLKNIKFGDEFDFKEIGDWGISAWSTSPRHNFSTGFYIVQLDNDKLNKHFVIPDSQSKEEFEHKKSDFLKRHISDLAESLNESTSSYIVDLDGYRIRGVENSGAAFSTFKLYKPEPFRLDEDTIKTKDGKSLNEFYVGEPDMWADKEHTRSIYDNPKDWEFQLQDICDVLSDLDNQYAIKSKSPWGCTICTMTGNKPNYSDVVYSFDFWEDKLSHDEQVKEFMDLVDERYSNALKEDTVKTRDGKWTNKGDEGTHGKFDTKKEADAQRKAMFANGYKGESLKEELDVIDSDYDDSHRPWEEVKKEIIKKYEKNGYKNVSVKRAKTDTKGLRMYWVYGEKKDD